jgi:hypothetical protein
MLSPIDFFMALVCFRRAPCPPDAASFAIREFPGPLCLAESSGEHPTTFQ